MRPRGTSSALLAWGVLLLLGWMPTARAGPIEPEPPAKLVERGRHLFLEETFAGNGRTCATCHRPENNFTLDPAFIAKLPANDPLFVSERIPALHDLERPKLLRRLALVTVHADGFDKPAVLRSVPHLLGLRQSMAVEPFTMVRPGESNDVAAAVGWSGDGAPGAGSLREFAVGAVIEHLPKTLRRIPGKDFRLPTADELEALEAYQLSLGRSQELDLSGAPDGLRFTSPLVERGRVLFHSSVSGPCSLCHGNAGALNQGGFNAAFDTGVAARPDAPARALDRTVPGDGGFGDAPRIRVGDRLGFGDRRMSTPSLIEAADTPPFFHDNSAPTIEEAVRFYTTTAFASSIEGQALPTIELTRMDIVAIGALLRVVNALENLRSSMALLREAIGQRTPRASLSIAQARRDGRNAIDVLASGPRSLHPDARQLVETALDRIKAAARAGRLEARDELLRQALRLMKQARGLMVG